MGIVVGRLSVGKGWAKTVEEKIAEKIDHYCHSGYSQSVVFKGNVRSLSKRRQEFNTELEGLSSSVKEDLTFILKNVFRVEPSVEVETRPNAEREGVYDLIIAASVTINGVEYDASKYVKVENDYE